MSKVRVSSALKDISSGAVQVDGSLKPLARIAYYNESDVVNLKIFTTTMTATVSPTGVSEGISGGGTATTESVTTTPTGGTAPYTYAWVKTSGEGTILNPNNATTRFSHSLANEDEATGIFECTVTDSLGATASATATASFLSLSSN